MTEDAPATRVQLRRAGVRRNTRRFVLVALAVQVAIGLVLRSSSIAATVYVGVTLVVALVAVVTARDIDRVAAAVGYVVATEVLWRMSKAHFFFEGGKYAMVALLLIASFRFFPGWRRALVPGVYLACFVVAVVLSVRHFGGVVAAREPISFNLAGPVALAVAVWFFSPARTTIVRFRAVLWATVLPIVSIATITLANTIAAGSVTFHTQSNFTTSGGFSPNEVSSALGFGALACILLAATERDLLLRFLEIGLGGWLFVEAVLTLSRGGVANVVVAVLLALLMMVGGARRMTRFALLAALAVVLLAVFLLPRLDDFTGGHLFDRYQSTYTSRRDLIVRDDLHQFAGHVLFGVGIGVSPEHRPPKIVHEEAHTEYTRLLAEQGVLGVVALVAFLVMVVTPFRRAARGVPRAFVAAFIAWPLVEMTHSATRLALTSYSIGLAVYAAGIAVAERAPESVDASPGGES